MSRSRMLSQSGGCVLLVGLVLWGSSLRAGAVTIDAADEGPIAFGAADLRSALAGAGESSNWLVVARVARDRGLPGGLRVPEAAEGFVLRPDAGRRRLWVVGRDATGTMYGLLELAERLRAGVRLEQVPAVTQSPYLEFRAPNPFLSLPDPDLTDWDGWWFRSEGFWRTYLDQLARARLNWVDLHGMLHIRGRWSFPAIFPYFVESRSFPDVGLPSTEKARNLAMLRRVIRMAQDRGIRLALMSYTTSWNVPGAPRAPYEETEANLALYTRECVGELLRQCPDLGMIGFRIGESGKSEGFFKQSYLPGVLDSGLALPIHTRTWLSSKPKILELAEAAPGRLLIEIKYNGEHFGLPYQVSGGRMAAWHSYSFQDYCRPPMPYGTIWQTRASGTHRLWRWGDPAWVERTVRSCKLGGGLGFSLEPLNAYRPNHDYYHRSGDLKWFRWVVERDWFWTLLWGRLAYDPSLDRSVWRQALAERFGPKAAEPVLRASEAMSQVIPLIYCAHCQGPDHLNMAPELETGGALADFAAVPPLDTLAMQSIPEYTQRLVGGRLSARTSPLQMADMLQTATEEARQAFAEADERASLSRAELADWGADIDCLGHMGGYYAAKIRAATYLELYRATSDPAHLQTARQHTEESVAEWRELARVTTEYYQPFVESMRPLTEAFTWAELTPSVEADLAVPEQVRQQVEAQGEPPTLGLQSRDLRPLRIKVTCAPLGQRSGGKAFCVRVALRDDVPDAVGYLYHKPLPSETQWRKTRMTRQGRALEGRLDVSPEGAQWAVEVLSPDAGAFWPDWRRETPYRVIDAWDGPVTPSSPPALPDLTRLDLSRGRFSAALCGRVAASLRGAPLEGKQALLDAVSAGQTLVLFNQDYPNGFDLSWLPGGITGTDADYDEARVQTSHPLVAGLPETLRYPKIVNDALTGGDGDWQKLTEPCGLAVRRHGQGEIILVQVRVEEAVGYPPALRLLRNVIAHARGESTRPMLLLDEGDGQVPAALEMLGLDDYVGLDG